MCREIGAPRFPADGLTRICVAAGGGTVRVSGQVQWQAMQIARVVLNRFRRFDTVQWSPSAGLNLLVGDNGAGKTSLLEAVHLLSYGRSFRGRVRDGLIQIGQMDLEVFAEWQDTVPGAELPRRRKAGLRHAGQQWTARLDGEDVAQLGQLCAALAVVTFEPGSHALISGAGEIRRRYLDWGLFHAEPAFMTYWRRYSRALKQRNALLKQGASRSALEVWDHELAVAGEPLTAARLRYLDRLQDQVIRIAGGIAPSLHIVGMEFQAGWRRHEMPLADALLLAHERDRHQGFTSVGPHRADWTIRHAHLPGRETLSRGQAKLTALCALLAQAADLAEECGQWPVLCLDDPGSELDQAHQGRILDWLLERPVQVLATATEVPPAFAARLPTVFHVEHEGRVTPQAGRTGAKDDAGII